MDIGATIIALLPILLLLVCLLAFKLSAMRASAISFLMALGVALSYYRVDPIGLAISMSKGFSLALFVVLIIWAAMFLYNLVKEVGALEVINVNIERIVGEKFVQFLLLSWVFSAFLQGIAGFGVPVIVVTPILIGMGFNPAISAAAVLVGHSWAISFGSMGSSIYAIDMVTSAEIGDIVVYMALLGTVGMFCTGLSVSFIYGGGRMLIRGLPYVVTLSVVMGAMLLLLAYLEMISVMGLIVGLTGMIVLFLMYKVQKKHRTEKTVLYREKLNLLEAMLPYVLIVVLSLAFYLLDPSIQFTFDFPGYETGRGIVVAAAESYVKFNVIKYPFTIILISSLISIAVFKVRGVIDLKVTRTILGNTVKKCIPTTITIAFLLNMAVLMMDSGMIDEIATTLVTITGDLYPLFAPTIGLLGAFVTGSNTNSNIIFGNLQEIAANTLGLSAAVMCAAQSIGASVGGAIGPTTVSLGATAAHIQGEESKIYRKTLAPVLLTVLAVGIVNTLIIY